MARKTTEQRLKEVHTRALIEFDRIQSALRDERLQSLQDRRFYSISGAQWEGPLSEQFESKPKLEVNKIHLAIIRIINEYRNNRITVDFVPKPGGDDSLADTCDDLYRATEQDSCADEAYDNAFEEAVGGGFGAWRLRTEYEDDEDLDDTRQRIRIEPIYDADSSVWFDLGAKRQDKSDAKRAYVLYSMTYHDYEETYDETPSTWPKEVQEIEFDWLTPDVVYVAEYYECEEYKETAHIYQSLDGEDKGYTDADFEADEELEAFLSATGARKVREKRVTKKRVHKYLMDGRRVIEDQGYIAGPNIPLVPVYGKRWFIDNVERCMGHVRLAKDAQRLKNMQLSKLAETAALSATEKPILLPEQVSGHQLMWSEDNIKNYPYLLINPVTDASGNQSVTGPVAYTKPPQVPPAMAALLQLTEEDMADILGRQEQGEEMRPNMSGKAIELVQTRLDMQSFIYMSNMSKAVRRSGEIWLGMAKEVFVEEGRKLKTVGAQEEVESVELMRPVINERTGEVELENDLSQAKFDVSVDVGPSSSSKRAATVRNLIGMIQITQDPQTASVLTAMAMMNMEGEGIGEVRKYFRQQLIKMGVVEPTEQEAADLMAEAQNAPPDPNAVYLQAAAEQAQAEAAQARADTVYTVARAASEEAKTQETRAKTVKTIADIEEAERAQAIEMVQRLAELLGATGEVMEEAPAAPTTVIAAEPPLQ